MRSPRWRKVLRDLFTAKTRTALVVLSIAVGVFAFGLIISTQAMLIRDLERAMVAARPASATFGPSKPFDDDLVQVVRRMRHVRDAEARSSTRARVKVGDQWRDLLLTALPDYTDIRIGTLTPVQGAWPPRKNEILIERGSLHFLAAVIGETLEVEVGSKRRTLRVAGVVHNPMEASSTITRSGAAFISLDTWERLVGTRTFNELWITVAEHANDRAYIQQIAREVRAKIEKGGNQVLWMGVPNPGEHPSESILQPILLILAATGFFALVLSDFLVANTISALLAQQTRQIGVMKALGARSRQLVGMYLVTAMAYGVLALLVAAPLGAVGAYFFAGFVGGLLNLDVTGSAIPLEVFALEAVLSLLVPVLAALWPVIQRVRITVREAISGYGLGTGRFGRGLLDQLLGRLRGLPRPTLLALRNTFRRRGRLALTLTTLTLAGTIVMTVLTIRSSLFATFDASLKYWQYDIAVQFNRPYRSEQVEREALRVPGVAGVESWGEANGRRIRSDGSESETLAIVAPPAETTMLQPTVVQGRWLQRGDQNVVVVNTDLLKAEPELLPGAPLTLQIDGKATTWRVVGVARGILSGPTVYVNASYLARVKGQTGRTTSIRVVATAHDVQGHTQLAEALTVQFKARGIHGAATTTAGIREGFEFQFNLIIGVLLAMALLLAVVGGLGLMGTLSINVLERTREIGVMRAIGASDGAIRQLVVVEALVIALLSWFLAALLARAVSSLLSSALGMSMLQAPLSYRFSLIGVALWLAVVLTLALLGSVLPAWNASRMTVREALAYE